MAKAEPFSIRLETEDDRFVTAEARRLKRSRGSILAEYAAEGIRTRRYPGIAFRGEDHRRRAWVLGTGLDVWEICQMVEEFESIDELVAETQLTERQVRLALAYREEYPEEIEEAIAENRRPLEAWQQLYPFVQTQQTAAR